METTQKLHVCKCCKTCNAHKTCNMSDSNPSECDPKYLKYLEITASTISMLGSVWLLSMLEESKPAWALLTLFAVSNAIWTAYAVKKRMLPLLLQSVFFVGVNAYGIFIYL